MMHAMSARGPILFILMPAYNEAPTIERAIEAINRALTPEGYERRLIIVDDGSTDGTGERLARAALASPLITHLKHAANLGKGAAVGTAIDAALAELDRRDAGRERAVPAGVRDSSERALPPDILLIHDADLEYDPADHSAVLAPIIDGRADAVIGSRFLGQTHRVLYYWHFVANRALTTLSNMLTNLNLTDIECCSKAFTAEVARGVRLRERGFGVEPELVARLARLRLHDPAGIPRRARIYETPVSYSGRTYAEGKKIGWRDGVHAIVCIVRYALWD